MKKIDKLDYKFPAGLCNEIWDESNFGNDAGKVVESFISCEFEARWEPDATYTF